jgi:small subunit ribosomal protein S29e
VSTVDKQAAKSKLKGKKVPKRTNDRMCRICGNARGIIHRYGLNVCRRCFREQAASMGFGKY